MRAIAGRDDRSSYGRRHSRAYETGRSFRFPGDRRRVQDGACLVVKAVGGGEPEHSA